MVDYPDPAWFLVRKLHCTATTNGNRAGLSKYGTPQTEVLRELAYPNFSLQDNPDMARGRNCEPHIIREASDRYHWDLMGAPLYISTIDVREAATADQAAFVRDEGMRPVTVEVKCPRRVDPDSTAPHDLSHVVQAWKQMWTWGLDQGHLVYSDTLGQRVSWKIEEDPECFDWVMRRSKRASYYLYAGMRLPSYVNSEFSPKNGGVPKWIEQRLTRRVTKVESYKDTPVTSKLSQV